MSEAARPPRDSLDLPALRDGTRRAIPWDAPVPPLDSRRLGKLVHAWTWRREQEHFAVGAFCELAQHAAEHGLDPAVLALLTRAATDEVHHADVCRRYVEALTGKELPLILSGKHHGGVPPSDDPRLDLLLRLVETSCLSETLTGAYFTDMLEIATWPTARAVILSLLEDEIDHGRLGWAALSAALRDEPRLGARVAADLPRLLDRTVREVFVQAREAPEADDPELGARALAEQPHAEEQRQRGDRREDDHLGRVCAATTSRRGPTERGAR